MSEINSDDLDLFIAFTEEKKKAKAELDKVNKALAAVQERLLEQFMDAGIQNVKANGHTIYLNKRFTAKAKDGDKMRAIAALKAAGLEDYLTFNSSQITAYFKESPESPAAKAFEFDNVYSVRSRKS